MNLAWLLSSCRISLISLFSLCFCDVFFGNILDVHDTAAHVVTIIGLNDVLIDIIDIKDEGRQWFSSRIVDLKLEQLVEHGITVVFDASSFTDLLLHSLLVAVLIYRIVDHNHGVRCSVFVRCGKILALEKVASYLL